MSDQEKLKKPIYNLTIILSAIFIGLLFVEVSLRLFLREKGQNTTIWINHEVLGYSHRPNFSFKRSSKIDGFSNHFRIDEGGFIIRRHPGVEKKGPELPQNIMILGDSMLQGNQVSASENMSVQLEDQLSKGNNSRIMVINLGANGYSPLLYMLAYQCYKKQFNPKLVIVFFTVGNDFNDDARLFHDNRIVYSETGEIKGIKPKFDYLTRVYWTKSHGTISFPWRNTSFWSLRTVGLIKEALKNKGNTQFIAHKKGSSLKMDCNDLTGRLTQRCHNYSLRESSLVRNNIFAIFKEEYTELDLADIELTLRYLSVLRDEVEADGRAFLLVILPIPAQIENQWEIGKTLYGINLKKEERIKSTAPQKVLINFCIRKRINYIDLLPVFRANSKKKLYWAKNTHLTKTGHSLLATRVVKWIEEHHNLFDSAL
jgi:hypothetical protein